jgi:hypothetical protein
MGENKGKKVNGGVNIGLSQETENTTGEVSRGRITATRHATDQLALCLSSASS